MVKGERVEVNEEKVKATNSRHHSTLQAGRGKIPLVSCCSRGSLYKLGLDTCNPPTNNKSWTFLPTLNSVKSNKTIADVTEEMFSLVDFQLDSCPDGFVSNSTKDFLFFDDGSLIIGNDRLEVGEFCINEIDSRLVADDIPAADSQIFAVRFCVPDPCITNSGPCIRKCCPFGSAIQSRPDELGSLCLPHPTPFEVSQLPFHSSEEAEIDNVNTTSFHIYDVMGLKCHIDGLNIANAVYPEEFVILADGRMNTTDYPSTPVDIRSTREYCVDLFYDLNETNLIELRCFPLQLKVPSRAPSPWEQGLDVYPYMFIISSVFTMAAFVVHAILPELRNIHGIVVMCYLAAISATYVGYGIIQLHFELSDAVCYSLAVFVHFAFHATFSWLDVVGFDVWLTFGRRIQIGNESTHNLSRRFLFYSIYGWGVPSLIVLVGQILEHSGNFSDYVVTPGFGLETCWFHDRSSLIAYLYGPMLAMNAVNLVMFFWTVVTFYKTSVQLSNVTSVSRSTQRFRVILSIFFLVGVSWVTEAIPYLINGKFIHWVFIDVVNILTGVFVFIIFVCKPKVFMLLKLRISTILLTCRRILPCIVHPVSASSRVEPQHSVPQPGSVQQTQMNSSV